MTRPQPVPLGLATALHAVAVLCLPGLPTLDVREDEDALRAGAWLRADLYVAITAHPEVTAITVRRPAAPSTHAQAITDTWRAMSGDAVTVSSEALATFAASLPAVARYASLPAPESVSRCRTVVDVVALRALAHGQQELRLYASTVREPGGTMAPAVVVVGEGWRAILRGLPKSLATQSGAVPFDPARPAALVCSGCSAHAGGHATEADALTVAARRRWQRRETDEGTVYVCAPCAQASARQAEAV